jgi:hypothetical protein
MVTVRYDDLSLTFDFISSAPPVEHEAYVSLDTGEVYWRSEFSDAFDEDVPDDLETSNRYLAVPHKNERDLGRNLALRFVAEELPESHDQVEGFFRRPAPLRLAVRPAADAVAVEVVKRKGPASAEPIIVKLLQSPNLMSQHRRAPRRIVELPVPAVEHAAVSEWRGGLGPMRWLDPFPNSRRSA